MVSICSCLIQIYSQFLFIFSRILNFKTKYRSHMIHDFEIKKRTEI